MERFPKSFKDLFACDSNGIHPRTIWNPLVEFFKSHGLVLWHIGDETRASVPPDSRVRAPDGFHYLSEENIDWTHPFLHKTPTLCPARTTDGRDVVIRVISFGSDGYRHRQAMERLSTGNVASVIGNHAVPVLQWLHLDETTFAVFPYLSNLDPTMMYLYENLEDLMAHMQQMLEAVAFCHSKLVAHRDIFYGNFLCNFLGGHEFDTFFSLPLKGRPVKPFRSLFPFTLYLIDFEMAVCFDPDSPPSTHLVSGTPSTGDYEYARPRAPELLTDQPYNPFLLDVWQLGTFFSEIEERNDLPPPVVSLIERMTTALQAERPHAAECLAEWRAISSRLTKDERQSAVTRES